MDKIKIEKHHLAGSFLYLITEDRKKGNIRGVVISINEESFQNSCTVYWFSRKVVALQGLDFIFDEGEYIVEPPNKLRSLLYGT